MRAIGESESIRTDPGFSPCLSLCVCLPLFPFPFCLLPSCRTDADADADPPKADRSTDEGLW